MKSVSQFNTAVLSSAAFAATLVVASAFLQGAPAAATANGMNTVTITAQRMTQEQKIAYDIQQSGQPMQTVLVAAKRLSAEEKFALDQQDRQLQQAKAHPAKKALLLV